MSQSNAIYRRSFAAAFLTGIFGTIPLLSLFVFFTLPMLEKKIFSYKQESTAIAVQSVFEILTTFEQRAQKGELSREAAQKGALELISKLRYRQTEYFWIHDQQPRMVMHPIKPELNGKDISEMKDPSGKRLFVEMVDAVKNADGDGFVSYQWAKPGSEKPVPKVSYVKLFKPWGWIVGNGVYVDDVEREIAEARHKNYVLLLGSVIFLLGASLFTARQQLRKWVMPVLEATSQLGREAESLEKSQAQMRGTAERLKESAQGQQSAVTEISAAVTEINDMMKSSVDTVRQSSGLANSTAEFAQRGQQSLDTVKRALDAISRANEEAVQTFDNLRGKISEIEVVTREIASKADMINSIVFQTKLLSFNASVEAARAGAQGTGFAVVAEEIGRLAQTSGESSKQIEGILAHSRTLMSSIVNDSERESAEVVQKTRAAISEGVNSTRECESVMGEMAKKSREASELTHSVLTAYEEQSKGVNEILKGVSLIDAKTSGTMNDAVATIQLARTISANSQNLNQVIDSLGTKRDEGEGGSVKAA